MLRFVPEHPEERFTRLREKAPTEDVVVIEDGPETVPAFHVVGVTLDDRTVKTLRLVGRAAHVRRRCH